MTPYLGEIRLVAFNFAPAGWAFCHGQLLPISEFDALFNLIGTTYGGDGQSTFAVPNLQSRVPVHQGNGLVLAETGGVESVTLTVNQIPAHSHPLIASSANATERAPLGNRLLAQSTFEIYGTETPLQPLNSTVLSGRGGSQPHNNLMPYLALNYVISLYGMFPSPT